MQKNINDKKEISPMFNDIQNMWVGADYWLTEDSWKWRDSYVDFAGITFCLKLKIENSVDKNNAM